MLESGDLIFVRENTEMGQAIQASTGNYSHVAIFLDGRSIMLRWKVVFFPSHPKISLKLEKSMTFIAIRRLITKKSKSEQRAF